ncbi:chorismate synthase [Lutispora thermophila]|uniref:Chorismate synthase n=1 Tax=Lutispora thermophila DSM 19022 TaxID=1122184 RepID=A0A1M6DRF6_9FIRM|nr:chorismate synthase [Lutispora thermophila]SHI75568.1 chorismate synthase [Lutispora thermophila DSM 19022]
MSGIWGNRLKVSIFGESHGEAIGAVIDGLPPGIKLDLEAVRSQMKRRAPGQGGITTARREEDEFQILSGFFNGYTTGTPLAFIIKNNDTRSSDYEYLKNVPRPGHGDYTGKIKYRGYNDYRGGGHFSGRITAPIVFVGAICRQFLEEKGIYIGSHIKNIGKADDDSFDAVHIDKDLIFKLNVMRLPLIAEEKIKDMESEIMLAKADGDSIGGSVECAVIGLGAGLGEPFFDSVESRLAHILFSIPGVKGVEFGSGFSSVRMRGSEVNDEFYIQDGEIKTKTNHCGGILGGITNGMPIIFRVAIKPTPSIAKNQKSVDMTKMETVDLNIKGRHDPCIVPRAVPVVEAAAAIGIIDFVLEE